MANAPDQDHHDEEHNEQDDLTWLQAQLAQQGVHIDLDQLHAAMLDGELGGDGAEWDTEYGGDLAYLLGACQEGDLDTLKELIEKYKDNKDFLNSAAPDGDRALNIATLHEQEEAATLLLEAGADPTLTNEQDGSTVLHDAAASGQLQILKKVAEAAPTFLNHPDEDGDTPLHNAARGNHLEVVKMLLEAGADKTLKNKDDMTPAQEADNPEVKQLLQ